MSTHTEPALIIAPIIDVRGLWTQFGDHIVSWGLVVEESYALRAWFDPSAWNEERALEKHGNPNALTLDIGASELSQGCVAQTCLVEVERHVGEVSPLTAGSV